MAFTEAFYHFVETWDVVVVWDKDHTMVDHTNTLRPNLEEALLTMYKEFPSWKHVILTENNLASVEELFRLSPSIVKIFDMVLCDDNFFSRKVIRKWMRAKGVWWIWTSSVKKERAKRKKRRVNDIFIGKKVVLIDDLRDGRIPEHSYCITCKVWTGEATHIDEYDWPLTIQGSILRILKNLYHYPVPKLTHPPEN